MNWASDSMMVTIVEVRVFSYVFFRFFKLFLTAHESLVATHHVINSSSLILHGTLNYASVLVDDTLIKNIFIMRTELHGSLQCGTSDLVHCVACFDVIFVLFSLSMCFYDIGSDDMVTHGKELFIRFTKCFLYHVKRK